MSTRAKWLQWTSLVIPALICALGSLLLTTLPTHADGPWYVDASLGDDANACTAPDSPCLTIGGALSKASAGDTINIAAGIYYERLTVDKSLTFAGAGAATTIVDGSSAGRIFDLSAPVTMQGLTLRNGVVTGSNNGGAIYTSSPLTLTAVSILTSRAYWGGGVYALDDVVVNNSRFEDNFASGVDTSNNARNGGGGLWVTGDLVVHDTAFVANRTLGDGGGVSARGAVTITGGIFERNLLTASISSGAAMAITGTLFMSGTQ